MEYILKRTPAKSADSSPPAPPRISTMTFLSSLGSLGKRRTFSSSCAFSCFSPLSSISRTTISRKSLSSPPASSKAFASSWSFLAFLSSRYFSTIGVRCFTSCISFLYFSISDTTSGSKSFAFICSYFSSIASSFSNTIITLSLLFLKNEH